MIWLQMAIQHPQIFQMTGSAYSKGDQRKERRLVSNVNIYLTLNIENVITFAQIQLL